MATEIENSRRRVVPRWRGFRTALETGELDPSEIRNVPSAPTDSFLLEKEQEWQANPTLLFATDFVGAAFVLGDTERATDAAQFILSPTSGASIAARSVAAKILGVTEVWKRDEGTVTTKNEVTQGIRRLKAQTVAEPRNAFVWADLARLYTVLGLTQQAARALNIAHYLAPNDRHVLRSLTRFHLHLHDPGAAMDLLRKIPAVVKADPWLLAAEIAVCSILDKSSRNIKHAQGMVEGKVHRPFQVSELASAVASVELWNGNAKKAQRFFGVSLEDPNDNALAQVIWATKYVNIEPFPKQELDRLRAFEAQALAAYHAANWNESLTSAKLWMADEPFSRRPSIHGSFLTSVVLEDFEGTVDIIERARTATPDDPTLLNNLAFAFAHLGKIEAAKEAIGRTEVENAAPSVRACLTATSGLIAFRSGKPDQGRELYRKAIEVAAKASLTGLKARALLYLAREELLAGLEGAELTRQEALMESSKQKQPDLTLLSERLKQVRPPKQ